MALRMAVLGSGSSGNSTLVIFENGGEPLRILIDAGLSPRETTRRLKRFSLNLSHIRHILITHLDHDHFRPTWINACRKWSIRMHIHSRFRDAPPPFQGGGWGVGGLRDFFARTPPPDSTELVAGQPSPPERGRGMVADVFEVFDHSFSLDDCIHVEPIGLPHDALGSVGFVFEHDNRRAGFATDLGRVSDKLLDRFVDLDLLAIESNYDRVMQVQSARPEFLKQRIMGGIGHLSNEQAFEAVLRIACRCRLQHIVLLHLSRQCNCPKLVRQLYESRAPQLRDYLTISDQFAPTALLALDRSPLRFDTPPVLRQPTLFAHTV